MAPRDTFSSRRAAIYAMAGSAIGLGNIWRFPYMVGEYGGAAFIIVYLVASVFLSLPILLSESIIGRRTHQGPFGALQALAPGTGWKYMGLLSIIAAVIILSFYSVVGGWSVNYLGRALAGQFAPGASAGNPFGTFISRPGAPLVFHTVFLGLTALIVLFGVKRGIEAFSKVSMPVLFFLILVIMTYSLSLPGASRGVAYLIRPDFSKLSAAAVASALGQSFFSLSLGVGAILTYSSHIRKSENLLNSGVGTAAADLAFAILAGFAVMPAVFAAGIEPGAGPGLIFETLPYIFSQMSLSTPWLGTAVAILFFLAILVAALTSSISMLETAVTYFVEQRGMRRRMAVLMLFGLTWTLGALCSLSFGPLSEWKLLGFTLFEFCDKLTSNFLMTIGGMLFTLFVGWQMKKADVRDELTGSGTQQPATRLFSIIYFLIRYVAPVTIAVIFVTNLVLS